MKDGGQKGRGNEVPVYQTYVRLREAEERAAPLKDVGKKLKTISSGALRALG